MTDDRKKTPASKQKHETPTEDPMIVVQTEGTQWGTGKRGYLRNVRLTGSAPATADVPNTRDAKHVNVGKGSVFARGRPPKEDWRNLKVSVDQDVPDAFHVLVREVKGLGFPGGNDNLHGLPKPSEPVIRRTVRMASSLFEAMKGEARATGLSLEEWMRRQFISGLAKGPVAPAPTGTSPAGSRRFAGLSTSEKSPKKQVALRLEDELLAAVDEAVNASGALKNDWLRAAIIKALDEGLDVRSVLESPAEDQD